MGERYSENRRLSRENYFMEEKIRELEVEIEILKGIHFVDGSFC